MTAAARLAAIVLIAACGEPGIVIQPIFIVPKAGDDATPTRDEVGKLAISVAHAGEGEELNLAEQEFVPGQTIELADVPFADDLVVHLTAEGIAYGRTCTFAVAADRPPPQPHLFFSNDRRFATLELTTRARIGGGALTYSDGSALIFGGTDVAGGAIDVADRVDPQTGASHTLGLIPRAGTVAALLGTDMAVVLGGENAGQAVGKLELIAANPDQPIAVNDYDAGATARIEQTATTLNAVIVDGNQLKPDRIIVIGGRSPGPGLPSGEINEVKLAASDGPAAISKLPAVLAHARAGHTATRLGDGAAAPVLIAGGIDEAGQPIAQAELFRPLNDTVVPASGASMRVPRTGHRALLMRDGSVIFIGGVDGANQPVRTLERFTLDAGFEPIVAKLDPLAGAIDFTATTLPDGKILIAGGRRSPGTAPIADAFILQPSGSDAQDVVVPATNLLEFQRAGHQATLLCDGTVLITGGTMQPTPPERFNPSPDGRR